MPSIFFRINITAHKRSSLPTKGRYLFSCLVLYFFLYVLLCAFRFFPFSCFFLGSYLRETQKVATASCFTRQANAYLNNESQAGRCDEGGDAMMMGSRKYRCRSTDGTESARWAVLGPVGRRKWMFYDEELC
jgi:hypothetical protein